MKDQFIQEDVDKLKDLLAKPKSVGAAVAEDFVSGKKDKLKGRKDARKQKKEEREVFLKPNEGDDSVDGQIVSEPQSKKRTVKKAKIEPERSEPVPEPEPKINTIAEPEPKLSAGSEIKPVPPLPSSEPIKPKDGNKNNLRKYLNRENPNYETLKNSLFGREKDVLERLADPGTIGKPLEAYVLNAESFNLRGLSVEEKNSFFKSLDASNKIIQETFNAREERLERKKGGAANSSGKLPTRLNQENVDFLEMTSGSNGNKKVYDAASTPDDAKEKSMKIKNLQKIKEKERKDKNQKAFEYFFGVYEKFVAEISDEAKVDWEGSLPEEKQQTIDNLAKAHLRKLLKKASGIQGGDVEDIIKSIIEAGKVSK